MLCLITSIFIKGGAEGGGGGAKIRIPVPMFSNGIRIFTDLKKQKTKQNKQCRTFICREFMPNDFHVLIKKSLVLFK